MKTKLISGGVALFLLFGMATANSACDPRAAQKVKEAVSGLAKISRDSGFIRVQWGQAFHTWPKDQQLEMAQHYANADACLSGTANEIRFYSPAGKFNAIASPTSGIRSID